MIGNLYFTQGNNINYLALVVDNVTSYQFYKSTEYYYLSKLFNTWLEVDQYKIYTNIFNE